MKHTFYFSKDFHRKVSPVTDRPSRSANRLLPGMLFMIGILLCAGTAFAASVEVYDQVCFADPTYTVATYGYDSYHWQPWSEYDTGTQSYGKNGAVSTGRAVSSAQYGILGSAVFTSTTGRNELYSIISSGALWSDTWTITAPGLSGMGTVKMHFEVEGGMNVVGPGDYIRGWQFKMFAGLREFQTNDGNTAIWSAGGPYSGVLDIPFVFGQPFTVTADRKSVV